MSDIAIRVEDLGKQFRLAARRQGYKTFRDALAGLLRPAGKPSRLRDREFWALKDVSFEIRRGEVVGVIGRNGAGKSTLLKILSRITPPTEGHADICGRVGSLLEVGTGFHPELSGRENVFLNGAILGMRRAEILRRFDDIVGFAEVEPFLDTPVKHYSSGMYLRLAFAVAAHLEPEILLVDEVLAVGDAPFQRKCLGKMGEVARQGRTVLLVSHNLAAISSLCGRALLLKAGQLAAFGAAEAVVRQYAADTTAPASVELAERAERQGNGRARIQRLAILDAASKPVDVVPVGATATFVLDYKSADGQPLTCPVFEIKLLDQLGQLLLTLSTYLTGDCFAQLPAQGSVCCKVPRFPLAPGNYQLQLVLHVRSGLSDLLENAAHLTVVEGDFFGSGKVPKSRIHGPMLVEQAWSAAAPP